MPRTGRPRGFDRDEAMTKAMHLFWQDGFEGVSIDRLRREMGGISSASFYAAFGSKEALYREALAAYLRSHGVVLNALGDQSRPPRDRVEAALRGFVLKQAPSAFPTGCMVTLSATVGSRTSAIAQALTASERAAVRAAFLACIDQALEQGHLRADTDSSGLATLLEGLLLGLSIQARDGVALATLNAAIDQALKSWDANVVVCPPGVRSAACS